MIFLPVGLANAPAARTPWVCCGIALLCLGLFLGSGLLGPAVVSWALHPDRGMWQGGLITYSFLHAGILHIAGNLLFLGIVGPSVESLLGEGLFAVFFLASGVFAGLVQMSLAPHSTLRIVGASGAIAALMGLFIVRFARHQVKLLVWVPLFFKRVVPIPSWSFGLLWLAEQAYEFATGGAASGHVAVGAHLGGFGFGAAAAWMVMQLDWDRRLSKPVRDDETLWQQDDEFLSARQALTRGDFSAALGDFQAVLERRPASASAAWGLAQVYLGLGQQAEAMPFLERAATQWWQENDQEAVSLALGVVGRRLEPGGLSPETLARFGRALEPIDLRYAREVYGAAARKGNVASADRLRALDTGAPPIPPRPSLTQKPPVMTPVAGGPATAFATLVELAADGLVLGATAGGTWVPYSAIQRIRVGAVDRIRIGDSTWRNVVITELSVAGVDGRRRTLRLPSHQLPLSLFPLGVAAQRAYSDFIGLLITRSGASVQPALEELEMGRYRRHATLEQFEASHAA